MINPSEEIVGIWLQDHHKYFVMSNIVVPKETRFVNGRKIGGGRGKEIDFLATNGKGKYYWVEVSVSPNPRLPGGAERIRNILIDDVVKKFDKSKEAWMSSNLKIKVIKKWFVYSPKLFARHNEEKSYCDLLLKKDIKAISFTTVMRDVYEELNHFGYDSPRQYIFLFKKMGYKSEQM